MNNTNKLNLNIEKGSITFWTNACTIDWSGSSIVPFFEASFDGNSIFILKDSDANLKFFHVFFGKGRTDVELNVKNLEFNEKHHIAITWSLESKEIALYVDGGKLKAVQKINY